MIVSEQNQQRISKMRQEVDDFCETWHEEPNWLSGWRHHYFCDDCGSYLDFQVSSPLEQRCPNCGRVYTDNKKNNAWVTIYRNLVIKEVRLATICYQESQDEKYVDFVKRVILFYADHYAKFPIHIKNKILEDMTEYDRVQEDIRSGKTYYDGKTTDWKFTGYDINFQGPGKIMAQGLSESIALIRLMMSYQICRKDFTREEQKRVQEELVRPAIEFLSKQQFVEHNITLWRAVAIQVLKLISGEFVLEDLTVPYGVEAHLSNSLTEDGFWYEESVHYHHYVMESLGYLAYFMNQFGYQSSFLEEKVTQMAHFAFDFAYDNGVFPNPNDGWPNINLKTYLNVYELLCAGYPRNSYLRNLYQTIRHLPLKRQPLPIEDDVYEGDVSSTGLLVLQDLPGTYEALTKQTKHFAPSKLSVLRNEHFNVCLKYGVNTLSHAHFDPLSMEFTVDNQVLSKDISNVGYGSPIVHTWYNTPVGHSGIVINEENNNILYDHQLVVATENRVKVTSKDIYPNVEASREIAIATEHFLVTTKVNCQKSSLLDVVQHFDVADLIMEIEEEPETVTSGVIYPKNLTEDVMKKIQRYTNVQKFVVKLPTYQVEVTFTAETPVTLYWAEMVGNPTTTRRHSLIMRSKSQTQSIEMMVKRSQSVNGNL